MPSNSSAWRRPAADSTAFIDDAAINTGCAISDGSFEQPALAAGAYAVAPGGSSWQFFGRRRREPQ